MEGTKRKGLIIEEHIGQLLMPGDELEKPAEAKATVGPGLKLLPACDGVRSRETIVVCKAGILTRSKPNVYYMELKLRNYSPYKRDDVVGVIKQKKGDHFVMDIGTRDRVTLSKFSFEGATKKFRPDHKIGDCIFGKLVHLPPDFPLEMTCINSSGKSVGQGLLSGGCLVTLPHHMVRILRNSAPKGSFMAKVGQIFPVEMAVGTNGFVWVKTNKLLTTILLCQLFQAASLQPPETHDKLIYAFRDSLSNF